LSEALAETEAGATRPATGWALAGRLIELSGDRVAVLSGLEAFAGLTKARITPAKTTAAVTVKEWSCFIVVRIGREDGDHLGWLQKCR
jgi:hypothetical protein